MDTKEKVLKVKEEALSELKNIENEEMLIEFRNKYLSKKGVVSSFMKDLKDLSIDEKKAMGVFVNELKDLLSDELNNLQESITAKKIDEELKKSEVDVTLSGKIFGSGKKHILTQVTEDIYDFFVAMGYKVEDGPEIESDDYNFTKLNLPKDHPARDMQDTFYITNDTLLRSQTSPVQVRTMLREKGKDIKMICPGKVYRRDDDDATHSHQFMQLEGLVVDTKTNLSDLKGILLSFSRHMFGNDVNIRLRPSYFPFTEPSFEVDVTCFNCHGDGCSICKNTGYIEVLGCGMVHENVLEACGYDKEIHQGYAFGVGIERVTMLKYGITDIRNMYINDIRFLEQF